MWNPAGSTLTQLFTDSYLGVAGNGECSPSTTTSIAVVLTLMSELVNLQYRANKWFFRWIMLAVITVTLAAGIFVSGATKAHAITPDGSFGPQSVRLLQYRLGLPQDGVISSQAAKYKPYRPALKSYTTGNGGSNTIRLLQTCLNMPKTSWNGQLDPPTIKEFQRVRGLNQNGIFDKTTATSLQDLINAGDIHTIKNGVWRKCSTVSV